MVLLKNNRKKILFLSSRLPYPPIGGDRLKNYWLLKILSKYFKVHLVSITEKNIPEEFYNYANELDITYKLFPKTKKEHFISTLKSLKNKDPLQVNYYYFKDVQDYIDEIESNFDILFATLVRTAKYIIDKNKPKILDMADLISLNYKNAITKSTSFFWKIIYNIEFHRLKNFEILCAKKFDKILLFNKKEVEILRKYTNIKNSIVYIPHGVNELLLSYEKNNPIYKNYVCFFGKMNYQPNIDAVFWFVNNVLPRLNENIKFCVLGAYPVRKVKELENKFKNVIVTGFIEDPYEILKSSLCVVAPMQTGAGIQNKVLEAMALGTKVILSSLAAKPIGAKNGRDYLVIDNPEKIAEIINDIYNNPQLYKHLEENSRKFIRENFTWTIYERRILEVIEKVLQDETMREKI